MSDLAKFFVVLFGGMLGWIGALTVGALILRGCALSQGVAW